MAEKQTKNQNQDNTAWATTRDQHITDFKKGPSDKGFRALAFLVWILGFACEISIALIAADKIPVAFIQETKWVFIILAGIISLFCALGGANLWRRAESIANTRSSHVISSVCATSACILMAVFFLSAKNASSQAKAASAVAVIAVIAICVMIALL